MHRTAPTTRSFSAECSSCLFAVVIADDNDDEAPLIAKVKPKAKEKKADLWGSDEDDDEDGGGAAAADKPAAAAKEEKSGLWD